MAHPRCRVEGDGNENATHALFSFMTSMLPKRDTFPSAEKSY